MNQCTTTSGRYRCNRPAGHEGECECEDAPRVSARSQRERAMRVVVTTNRALAPAVLELAAAIKDLDAILEAAQNAPPAGTSDGTIDEVTWTGLRDYRRGIGAAVSAYESVVKTS